MSDDRQYPVLPSGHTVVSLDAEANQRIQRNFPHYGNCIRLWPGGWFFAEEAPAVLAEIQKFEFRPGDVVVMSFPKSGTSWSQEIVWTMLHNPNLDNPKSAESIDDRSPQIDADTHLTKKTEAMLEASGVFKKMALIFEGTGVDRNFALARATRKSGQRVLKTHLAISLLPKDTVEKTKVVYMARDPRDVIVSRFKWMQVFTLQDFRGDFEEFVDLFLREELIFNPYWKHLEEAWNLRNHPNFLFLKFEDLKADPLSVYEKISKHLDVNLTTEKLEKIVDFTSFKAMKERADEGKAEVPMASFSNVKTGTKTSGFFRKGEAGDWNSSFSDDQVKKVLKWIQDKTEGFPDDFPYLIKDAN